MSGDRTYRVVVFVVRVFFRALGLRFRIEGSEHIPSDGPAVLASNHLSYLDFMFVGLAARPRRRLVRFMAKQSVFDAPVVGNWMRRMGHIPVDRTSGAAAYRKATRALAGGELVGVFPEATISRSWTLKQFKLGAATLAVREGVPLLPVVLWAPHRTFTVDRRYSFRRGTPITVLVGAPVPVAPTDSPAAVDAELHRRMDALLRRAWDEYPDGAGSQWWVPRCNGGTAATVEQAAAREAEHYRLRAERKARKQAPGRG